MVNGPTSLELIQFILSIHLYFRVSINIQVDTSGDIIKIVERHIVKDYHHLKVWWS